MAALQKIRNHAGMLITVIAVALGAFVVGDLLTSTSTIVGKSRNTIGEIDGEDLSIIDFNQMHQEFSTMLKQQYQGQQLPPDEEIRNLTWDKFVSKTLISNELSDLGLTVTDEEISDQVLSGEYPLLRQIPIFYRDGRYDPTIVHNFIQYISQPEDAISDSNKEQWRQTKQFWAYWEEQIKNQMAATKIVSLVGNAVSTPKALVDRLSEIQNNEKTVVLVKRPYSSREDVELSDAEIKEKYDQMKERKYKTEAYKSIDVVLFNVRPSDADYENTEDRANEIRTQLKGISENELPMYFQSESNERHPYVNYYRSEKSIDAAFTDFAFNAAVDSVSEVKFADGQFMMAKKLGENKNAPDSANISIMLIAAERQTKVDSLADSIMTALKGGADFAELTRKYSLDQQTAAKGGEIGWITEVPMLGIPGLENKVFSSKKGDFFTLDMENNPAKFVVKVNDLTAPVKKAKISVLAIDLEPSTDTYTQVYGEANKFAIENRNQESFENSANEKKLQMIPVSQVYENQTQLMMLQNAREIIKWAWDHEKGDVSSVFDQGNMYVVACVTNSVEKGYNPLDQVKSDVERLAQNSAKAKLLKEELDGMNDLVEPDTVNGIRFSRMSVPGIGREPALIGAISGAKENEVSDVIIGDNGVYKFKVVSSETSPITVTQEQENRSVRSSINTNLFEAIKEKSEIVDNRSNFF